MLNNRQPAALALALGLLMQACGNSGPAAALPASHAAQQAAMLAHQQHGAPAPGVGMAQRLQAFYRLTEQRLPFDEALQAMVSEACLRVYEEEGATALTDCAERLWHTLHWPQDDDRTCQDGVYPSRLARCTDAVEELLRRDKAGGKSGTLLALAYADEMCAAEALCRL